MARIIKERAVRRNEILDMTQRLVITKGYEQMTIQDILDALQLSKGAFYHYFGSKQALLEALIERMAQEAQEVAMPIVHDASLSALAKFERFFASLARWKTAQKQFLLEIVRVWYTDDNLIVRQKMQQAAVTYVGPLLAEIIQQGIEEGVFTPAYPDYAGPLILTLFQDCGDRLAHLLLSWDEQRGDPQQIIKLVAAYTDAVERVLGAPKNSLHLVDDEILKVWFVSS